MIRIGDEGVVLRRAPFRESSLVVTLFSRHHGRLAVLAKGVRQSAAKQGERAALSGLHTARFFATARTPDALPLLNMVEIVTPRHRLTATSRAVHVAQLFQELLYRCTPEQDPQPGLFSTLVCCLDKLEHGPEDPLTIAAVGCAQFVRGLGFGWRWDCCAGCQDKQGPPVFFSVRRGQWVCQRCGAPYAHYLYPISAHLARIMPSLEFLPAQQLLSSQDKERLLHMALSCLAYHGGWRLRAAHGIFSLP
jgi:DNA repair protein RecO (recombination protein O)